MDEVYEIYTKLGHTVYGASLYLRDESVFHPTMYWNRIEKDAVDVEFPWYI
jgi:hypothetical protein